ncbi:hypothetical protein [Haloferula sp. BvORR071]|uniref:hypothetical protein n=1 Tax=Haloferula sp. BvORR071 TaxID=1396141 RepID=UPI00055443BA|nr:hypothetical protein [Haloferula sp. BvORR071]
MNRLRSEPKTHVSVFITLILAAIVMVGGGIAHAVYKNKQVRTYRLIDQAEKRIEQTRTRIRMVDVRMSALLDRYAIKDRLKESGTAMLDVKWEDVEEISPNGPDFAEARELP